MADAAALTVSVIVPHLNQPVLLRKCLAAIAAGTRQPAEVIVVDNGSHQLPEAVVADFAGTRLINEAHPGPGPARNAGAAAAMGAVLAFTDADCLPGQGWIAAIESAFADPDRQVIGGDVSIACADQERMTVLEAYESVYGFQTELYVRRDGYAATLNMAVRADIFARVGPFVGLEAAEDREWGQRASALGVRIEYWPSMAVAHPARESLAEINAKWGRHIAHDFNERQGGMASWMAKALALGVSPLIEAARIARTPQLQGIRNRVLAWAGLSYVRLTRMRLMLWLALGGRPERLLEAWKRES